MGQFDLNIPDIQAEIKEKFGTASGHIQKWYPLKSRGNDDDGEISGDLLLRFEVISGNSEVIITIKMEHSFLTFKL